MHLFRKVRGGWASAAVAATAPDPVVASVDQSTIRHRFNFEWCYEQDEFTEVDTWWWWATSIRVDPNELWAEDEEGNLWVVPFSTDGADEVTFGTPERARLVAVPVAASAGVQANQMVGRARQRVLAANLERPTKPPRNTNTAAAESAPDERSPMDTPVLQALARQHGLDPASATEEEVNAAVLAAATAEPPEEAPEVPAADVPEAEVPEATPADERVPVLAAAAAALGLPATATEAEITEAAERLRRGSEAGATVARSLETQTLDSEADAAVSDGRIYPSARAAWRASIDPGDSPTAASVARATAERQALAALTTNRVPVRERGATPDPAQAAAGGSLARALAASGIKLNTQEG